MNFLLPSSQLILGKNKTSKIKSFFSDSFEEKGQGLFMLFESSEKVEKNSLTPEKIFSILEKELKKQENLDAYVRLEETLRNLNKNFKKEQNFNVAIGLIEKNTLHLTQTGSAEVYLLRKNNLSAISEGLKGDNENGIFNSIASGELEEKDTIIISTSRLLRYATKTEIIKIFSNTLETEESLENLADVLTTEEEPRLGVLTINVKSPEKKEEPIEIKRESIRTSSYDNRNSQIKEKAIKIAKQFSNQATISIQDLIKRAPASANLNKINKDQILLGFLIVIVILIIGVTFVLNRNIESADKETLRQTIVDTKDILVAAEQRFLLGDKLEATNIILKAEEKIQPLLKTGLFKNEVAQLQETIQKQKDNLDARVRIENPRLIADLSKKQANIEPLGILSLNNNIFAFNYNSLYEIILDQINDAISIEPNDAIVGAAVVEDSKSLIFFTKAQKMLGYIDGQIVPYSTANETWKEGIALASYGKFIYLLDPSKNQIWKYEQKRQKFSEALAYNIDADLNGAIDLVIDGNIWVLKNDGSIIKIFKGHKENFTIKDNPLVPVNTPTKIYTHADTKYVYLLDPVNQRVVRYFKDLKTSDLIYGNQYNFDNLKNLKGLYVEPTEQKMYVLDGTKVYEIALDSVKK